MGENIGLIIGLALMAPLAIMVIVMSSKLKDPSIEKLVPLPDEQTLLEDETVCWGLMPSVRRSVYTSVFFMKGMARATNHRIILCCRYAFSRRYCVRSIAYYKGGVPSGMGDYMVDGYPSFTLEEASVVTTKKGKKRLHLASKEKGIGLPDWVEIETDRLDEYLKVLGIAV